MRSSRKSTGWLVLAVGFAVVTCGWFVACDDSSDSGSESSESASTDDGFDRNALLANYANNLVIPTLDTFASNADALVVATADWAEAASGGDAQAEKEAAQAAWRVAMETWQRLELMAVGPAGSSSLRTGGQDLRDEIYSWTSTNPCRVDQETLEQGYAEADFFTAQLVNTRGLDTLEYLLFAPDGENDCAPQHQVNEGSSWNSIAEELGARRAAYAAGAAGHVAAVAAELVAAWSPDGGDFGADLATAGQSGSSFSSAQAAIDEVFAALWYAERMVKDFKLGEPLGLSPTCAADTCPDSLELRWSQFSREATVANMHALRAVLSGSFDANDTDALGFDDFLVARDAGELATTMLADTDSAIASLSSLEAPFEDVIFSAPDELEQRHAAVKTVMDEFKTQFATVLGLRIPDEGAGDND